MYVISAIRSRALLKVLGALAAVILTSAPSALANEFTVFSCHTPSGAATGDYGWRHQATSSGTFLESNNTCAGNGAGGLTAELPGRGSGYYNQEGVQWLYTVPSWASLVAYHLSIADAEAYASGGADNGNVMVEPSDKSDPYYDYRRLGGGSECEAPSCTLLNGISGQAIVERTPPDAVQSIVVYTGCDAEGGSTCPAQFIARSSVAQAIFLLNDKSAPKVSELSGSLNGAKSATGQTELSFHASESAGPGIYSAHWVIDGAAQPSVVLSENASLCKQLGETSNGTRSYDSAEPCLASVESTMGLETANWSDGERHVQLVVEDAAGNTASAFNAMVGFDNAPVATGAPTDKLEGLEGGAPRYNVDDPSENLLKAETPATFAAPAGAGNITTQSFWERCNAAGEACGPIASATGSTYTFAPQDIGHSIRYATSATDKDGSTTVMSSATPEVKEYVPPSHSDGGTESPLTGPIGSTTINSSSTTTNSSSTTGGSTPPAAIIQMTGLAAKWLHFGRGITRNYNQSGLKITGRLLSPSGAPLAGQTVYLESGPIGGTLHIIEHAVSGANGYWTMRAPRGTSRLLKVIYGPQEAIAAGTQVTRNLVEHVRPGIRFYVSSFGAGILAFRAQVAFGPTSPPLLAVVQARGVHGWQDVGGPRRVGRRGVWTSRYSASTLIGHRYTFRLYIPSTHMALSATSRPITATVN